MSRSLPYDIHRCKYQVVKVLVNRCWIQGLGGGTRKVLETESTHVTCKTVPIVYILHIGGNDGHTGILCYMG